MISRARTSKQRVAGSNAAGIATLNHRLTLLSGTSFPTAMFLVHRPADGPARSTLGIPGGHRLHEDHIGIEDASKRRSLHVNRLAVLAAGSSRSRSLGSKSRLVSRDRSRNELLPIRDLLGEAIFNPCRFSIVETYVAASSRLSGVPVSNQAKPRPILVTLKLPRCK